VIVSETGATASSKSTTLVSLTRTVTPCRVSVRKPLNSARTSYDPSGRNGIRYSPSPLVTATIDAPVAVLRAVTVTPGSTLPC
jgi:hypothetical protein